MDRKTVEMALREFESATSFDSANASEDVKFRRHLSEAVDRFLLEYLLQRRLRMLRMITSTEEKMAKLALLESCRALNPTTQVNAAMRSARGPSIVHHEIAQEFRNLQRNQSIG